MTTLGTCCWLRLCRARSFAVYAAPYDGYSGGWKGPVVAFPAFHGRNMGELAVMHLEPGRLIGPYEVQELLGSGGMGEVYRARDRKLGRDVALKVIRPQIADRSAALARFQREVQVMSSLRHPAIVTVFDAGEVDEAEGIAFVTMELLEGESLRSWLSRPRERSQIIELLAFVADGLASAHDRQIVHRDIKPENIMVLRDGYAKIVDFGLAKLLDGGMARPGEHDQTEAMLTRGGQVVGTMAYMSPEQLNGAEVDGRSDIFSFGCVLSEALSGRHPFAAPTRAAMLNRLSTGRFEPLQTDAGDPIATFLNALIARCLAPEIATRCQTMQEVARELKRLSRGSSGTASGLQRSEQRRSRWVAPLALTAAMLIAVALFFVWRTGATKRSPSGLDPELNEMFNRAQFLAQDREDAVKDRSIPLLEAITRRQPSFTPAHVELASQYSRRAFTRDADRIWEERATLEVSRILALDANSAAAYSMRGSLKWTAAHAYDHEEALAAFNQALALDPNYAPALRGRASIYLHVGLLDAAQRDLDHVLRAFPNDDFALYRVPRILIYTGKYEAAIAEYRRHSPSAFELPIALSHAGRDDEASDLATRLVQGRQGSGDAWSTLAVIMARRKDRKAALDAVRRAVELGEGSSHFHHAMYNIAVAYAQLGDSADAMRWLDRTAVEGLPCTPLFEHDPYLDPLRGLPRFQTFLRDRSAETARLRQLVH
jgi:serine/threonine protein kinase/Flp pilus assembly protein TadD